MKLCPEEIENKGPQLTSIITVDKQMIDNLPHITPLNHTNLMPAKIIHGEDPTHNSSPSKKGSLEWNFDAPYTLPGKRLETSISKNSIKDLTSNKLLLVGRLYNLSSTFLFILIE